jgi:hypothetical protein
MISGKVRMMMRPTCRIAGSLLATAMLVGCQASNALSTGGGEPAAVLPSLVFAPSGADRLGGLPDAGSWEAGRNDRSLGLGGETGLEQWQSIEVRRVDHRWTLNGRVRESSRTTTRTLRRGILRSD